jgi:hypothetical protein
MKNLAGVKNCDIYIKNELRSCGIDIVEGKRVGGEVAASLQGKLKDFTFQRAWYYWVVEGLVPLHVAQELYADEVGKTDIRVAGHCDCPAPEKPWVTWVADDGREIISENQKKSFKELAKSHPDWEEFKTEAVEKRFIFSDKPELYGSPFIDSYHIDSELGLKIFADRIKKAYSDGDMDFASKVLKLIEKEE